MKDKNFLIVSCVCLFIGVIFIGIGLGNLTSNHDCEKANDPNTGYHKVDFDEGLSLGFIKAGKEIYRLENYNNNYYIIFFHYSTSKEIFTYKMIIDKAEFDAILEMYENKKEVER